MDTAAPTFAPGSEFAGYRIESVAGRGGMGIVYRATQLALGRPVALKLLAAQYAADEDFRERFRREWETAAAIDHPNVIPLYEAGEAQDHLFLAMRYVDGVDLANLMPAMRRWTPRAPCRILAQIASALDAAHARGLVHRDVKPANVLMGEEDHVYLTDFGLSRETAPEPPDPDRPVRRQHRLRRARADPRRGHRRPHRRLRARLRALPAADGRVPFDRAATWRRCTPTSPSRRRWSATLRPELPAGSTPIVERAMAKEPDERYQSAGELARAAAAVIGIPAAHRVRARRPPRRRPRAGTPPRSASRL